MRLCLEELMGLRAGICFKYYIIFDVHDVWLELVMCIAVLQVVKQCRIAGNIGGT